MALEVWDQCEVGETDPAGGEKFDGPFDNFDRRGGAIYFVVCPGKRRGEVHLPLSSNPCPPQDPLLVPPPFFHPPPDLGLGFGKRDPGMRRPLRLAYFEHFEPPTSLASTVLSAIMCRESKPHTALAWKGDEGRSSAVQLTPKAEKNRAIMTREQEEEEEGNDTLGRKGLRRLDADEDDSPFMVLLFQGLTETGKCHLFGRAIFVLRFIWFSTSLWRKLILLRSDFLPFKTFDEKTGCVLNV